MPEVQSYDDEGDVSIEVTAGQPESENFDAGIKGGVVASRIQLTEENTNDKDGLYTVTGISANPPGKKPLNIVRRLQNHPALCKICKPAKDFFAEYVAQKQFRRRWPKGLRDKSVTFASIDEDEKILILKDLEKHKKKHTLSDLGPVRYSDAHKAWTGQRK